MLISYVYYLFITASNLWILNFCGFFKEERPFSLSKLYVLMIIGYFVGCFIEQHLMFN
ncbi:hypothetical protein L3V83_13470 [Thiotrichales bacterium 19X7-9]|nr:hypothetical protein [Thiotrichales bacterium 19X7-9]